MRRFLMIFLTFVLIVMYQTAPALAKKAVKKTSGAATVFISRMAWGRGINVTFGNLAKVRSVTYMLSYTTNGKPEGAIGTLSIGRRKNISRQLLFGTCSSGVCRYHTNVRNAYLEVTSTLKNGRETTRSYKIR